jgi:hypothetical protein
MITERSLRGGRSTALALALTTAVILSTAGSAHRRDEYLQAARLAVEPGRVDLELDLTPGIAVAEAIIADIDRDRDGLLSADEQRAYLGRVREAVVLELDGRPLHLEPIGATFPAVGDFRRGEGTIRVQSAVVLHQANGDHHLSFRNMNPRDVSVYLANALVPMSDRIAITAQRRDATQRDLTIDYVLRPGPDTSAPTWLLCGLTGAIVLAALLMRPSKVA